VAELAAVQGRRQRWRFTAGVLRLVLFPPATRPGAVRVTAATGMFATVAATVVTARLVPAAAVFVATLGLLATGYATALACRWPRLPAHRAQLFTGAVTVAAVFAVAGVVISVAVTDPAATTDPTHIFSAVLAATLCGYLMAGLRLVVASGSTRIVLWGGICAAAATVAGSSLLPPSGIVRPVQPVLAAATFGIAILVSTITRSGRGGVRAGLLAALLVTPTQFAVDVTALQLGYPHTLANQAEMAAYLHSGYPTVASYLLSDALDGRIISLVVTPFIMYVIARFGVTVAGYGLGRYAESHGDGESHGDAGGGAVQ
jgi:hypothetical protein